MYSVAAAPALKTHCMRNFECLHWVGHLGLRLTCLTQSIRWLVQVDSKRQLEESLKWACNSFIQHASNSLADGLISLLKMVEAFLPPDRTAPSPEQASTSMNACRLA